MNLAASLAAMKRRVLIVDLDPQGNATTGSGVDKRGLPTLCTKCCWASGASPTYAPGRPGGYDLVPANRELAGAEVELVDLPERETRLKDALPKRCSR